MGPFKKHNYTKVYLHISALLLQTVLSSLQQGKKLFTSNGLVLDFLAIALSGDWNGVILPVLGRVQDSALP